MMFIESEELLGRIREVADEIKEKTGNKVIFEEYIALPFYGNIILRFNLTHTVETIEDLDKYENIMYEVVKDEFLIDFMGNVYQDAGLDYRDFDNLLRKACAAYKQEQTYQSKYAAAIRTDAENLLARCGVDTGKRVWEIQPEEDILLLIMAEKPSKPQKYFIDGRTVVIAEVDELCCEGLMKAAFYAKRNHISLIRTEMDLH